MPGTEYLLAVAALAMAFVAFSVIVLVVRQIAGGALTAFHTLLVRYTIECGFIATISALFPVLLSLSSLSHSAVARISSGLLAGIYLTYVPHYIMRRRRVMPGPLPPRFLIIGAVAIAIDAWLWLNAIAWPFSATILPYALAVTWILMQSAIVFLLTFEIFLQQRGDQRSGGAA